MIYEPHFAERALWRANRRPNMKPLAELEPEVPTFTFTGRVTERGREMWSGGARDLAHHTPITVIAASHEEATEIALRQTPRAYPPRKKNSSGYSSTETWRTSVIVEWASIKQVGA